MKKIYYTLPFLCADKGFKFVSNVICTNKELVKADHLLTYPNESLWSTIMYVHINTVDTTAPVYVTTGAYPIVKVMAEKIHVFDANM